MTVIHADTDTVSVDRVDNDVQVTWVCGATRRFTPDELKAAIEHMETVGTFADVWCRQSDSSDHTFYGRLEKGQFYADERVSSDPHHVPWAQFKKALLDATKKPRVPRKKKGE